MHPNLLDPELGALTHRVLGALGPSSDDDGLDTAGDRWEILVGAIALDLVGVRVDREDLVAALAQPPVDVVAPVAAFAVSRDSGYRHPFVGQELRGCLFDVLHCSNLLSGDQPE